MPVEGIGPVVGTEWDIAPVEQPGAVPGPDADGAGAPAGGFGAMLGDALGSLVQTQQDAAAGAQQLAAGAAQDPTAAVMAVERAQLAMQLAAQVRTKVVEAAQDLFHTQV